MAEPHKSGQLSISLHEAARRLRLRQISSAELTRACLARIEALNPKLNAFITVTADQALNEAEQADRELHDGLDRGPLHGIPIALKDLIDTAEVATTAGSKVFEHRIPERDATVVRKLRDSGAVFLGKLNMHEFAYGGSGVISYFGPTRNPHDPERTTGGSSSGAAAAVASGMCFAAIGSDTAGSIREPSAFCGIVGLKPTFGLVSCAGVIPLCWSYDHVGPMTRSVLDAALVLNAIAGHDPEDPNSLGSDYRPISPEEITKPPTGVRIAVAGGMFLSELDPEVEQAFKAAVQLAARVFDYVPRTIELPLQRDRTLRSAESYAYHAPLLREHAEEYQPATLHRILAGEGISAVEYKKKKDELFEFRRSALRVFNDIDVILSSTAPCLPDRISDLLANPSELRTRELHMLRNTKPFNDLGFPAISIPCGSSPSGLPIGLQLAAAPGNERLLLQASYVLEQSLGK